MPSSRTSNFRFYLPDFNARGWDTEINGNTRVLDALLAKYISLRNIQGIWENSTAYDVDQVLVDDADGTLWAVNNNHTSSPSPTTFATERTNNPSYWRSVTFDARYRGEWTTGTTYYIGDFVISDSYYAVAKEQHTAGATFAGDSSHWDVLLDLTTKLDTDGDGAAVTVKATGGTTYRTLASRFAVNMDAADMGAVGDGTTDDTSAIQALLTACSGKVARLVPNKTYVVSGVTIPANTTIDGRGATLKLKAGSTSHVLSGTSTDNIRVRNVVVDGNVSNCPSAGSGIVFTTSDNVLIEDCVVYNTKQSGIYLYNCTRSAVSRCVVTDTGATGIYAYGTGLRVIGNTIATSAGANITYEGAGIVIGGNECAGGGPSGDNITGYAVGTEIVSIFGNVCRSSLNHGIHAGGSKTSITGNTVYAPAQSGIRYENNDSSVASDVTISGNQIYAPTVDGIYMSIVDRGAISGNTIHDAANGINLLTTNLLSVVGNTITGCSSHGIRVTGTRDSTISANTISGNGGDGISIQDDGAVTSLRNAITSNRCLSNASYGIRELDNSNSNTMVGNVLVGNTSGTVTTLGASSSVLTLDSVGTTTSGMYAFVGDTNTGLTRVSADVVALTAGGVNKVVAATNYVTLGDGTLNPNNFNFRVNSFNETSWDSLSGVFQYYKRAGTSINAPTVSAADQLVYSVEAQGHTGSGYMAGAKIKAIIYDTPGVNVMPMSLVFETAGSSGAPVERFRIKPFGQLHTKPLAADPSPAANGDWYYNSTTHKFRGYANGTWVDWH